MDSFAKERLRLDASNKEEDGDKSPAKKKRTIESDLFAQCNPVRPFIQPSIYPSIYLVAVTMNGGLCYLEQLA